MIYKTSSAAKRAYQKLHKLKFDKEHTFACFTVREFNAVEKINDSYIEPKIFPKKELLEFNFDEKMRDQFILRAHEGSGDKIHLNWFDYIQKEAKNALKDDESIKIENPANNIVFSPRGNYAAIC